MQAYAEGFDILRNKDSKDLPEDERFTLNMPDIAEVWRRGSVISSWLLDLGAAALAKDPQLKKFSGYVQDSGEGRWTVEAAIEEAVPADVLTSALYARFRSRQEHTFGEKMLSAMRFGFGGHVEGQEPIDPEPKPKIRSVTRRHSTPPSSAMPDNLPIRTPQTAQVIACPPRRQAKPADPCAMVIFGATGDLTKRLVVPALYNLSRTKMLPEKFALIGVARTEGTARKLARPSSRHAEKLCRQRRRGVRRRPDRRGCVEAACGEDVLCPGRPDQARAVRRSFAARSTRPRRPTAPRATPSSISPSPIGSSAPWWSSSARRSSPIRTRTRTASVDSGAAW